MKYVLGLVFDEYLGKVVLIKRNKNPYEGMLNGLGGKVEEGESGLEAMQREWKEETNTVKNLSFYNTVNMSFDNGNTLEVYTAFIEARTIELPYETKEGQVSWYDVNEVLAGDAGPMAEELSYYILESTLVHLIQ